ncbi:hypothetical protein ACHAQA_010165 [Verticillium albo-atrum]
MAEACHSYSAISERYRFWDPKKLTYQFMAEARGLWEIEMKSGEDRITTVQASMVLCAGYSTTGLDQLGADYLVQGTRMAERMQIFGSLDHVKNPFRRKVYAMTAWALSDIRAPGHHGADLAARKMAQGLKLTAADAVLFRTTLVAWFNSLPPFLSPEYVTLPAHLKIQ